MQHVVVLVLRLLLHHLVGMVSVLDRAHLVVTAHLAERLPNVVKGLSAVLS